MYVSASNDRRQSVHVGSGGPIMRTHSQNVHCLDPTYNNTADYLQRWQNSERLGESLRSVPQQNFTQVTTSARERKINRHGGPGTTHAANDLERQRSDITRTSTCVDRNQQDIQYHQSHTGVYYGNTEALNANSQVQHSPQMLWQTDSSSSAGCHAQDHWDMDQIGGLGHAFHQLGSWFGPNDCCSQSMGLGLPLTPVGTINEREALQKSSLGSEASPFTSPLAYKSESTLRTTAPSITFAGDTVPDDILAKAQQRDTPLTPPPEGTAEASGLLDLPESDKLFDHQHSGTVDPDRGDDINVAGVNSCVRTSPTPFIGDEPSLDLFAHDWEPSNFDFFDESSTFTPAFMSDRTDSCGLQQYDQALAHQTLLADSGYCNDIGNFPDFHRHIPLASGNLFGCDYGQSDSCVLAPDVRSVPNTSQIMPPTFEAHTFNTLSESATRSDHRASNRSKSKDHLLMTLKRQGYSYKDIKVMGQFEEAESTLRGRYRTLTKPREARVRKPEWGDREIELLLAGVAAHSNPSNDQPYAPRNAGFTSRRATKIPWKQVAEYMAKRGAYKYGNATVKKKWTEVMEERHQRGF